jgi:hypothetical protein
MQNWRIAMEYEDVCNLLLTANKVRVVVHADTAETLDPGYVVFKNAQLQEVAEIEPSQFDIYVAVLGESEYVDLSKMVSKDVPAASAGILQISGGADRSVKDWVPGGSGLIKTDADGKPALAIKGVDYETPATETEYGVVKLVVDTPSTSETDAATPAYVNTHVEEQLTAITVDSTEFPDKTNDVGLATPAYVETAISTAITEITVDSTEFPDKENDVGLVTPAYVEAALQEKIPVFATDVTDAPAGAAVQDADDPSLELLVEGASTSAISLRTMRSLGGTVLGYAVLGSKA